MPLQISIRSVSFQWTMMNPSPPMPDIRGSTTFSAAAVAMAASTALPPCCKMEIPA